MVKGDLIVPTSNKIMTRSQAKQSMSISMSPLFLYVLTISAPDQFTIIHAPLKILKVLIEELLSASGMQSAANQAAAAAAEFADEEADDDSWEDVPNVLDLGLGSTKAELMAFDGASSFIRQRDDETQAYLTEFFVKATNENIAGFNEIYTMLTDDEKLKLNELAHSQTQAS